MRRCPITARPMAIRARRRPFRPRSRPPSRLRRSRGFVLLGEVMRSLLFAGVLALLPVQALAWGYAGHQMIGEVAARHFSAELPAFLRTRLAVTRIGLLSQEPDVSRSLGQPHDADLDSGHFLDVSDDG